MNSLVLNNLARVAERHVTNVARVRLLTGVNSTMHRVRRHRRKRFSAQVAQDVTVVGAGLVSRMNKTQVLGEVAGETKRLVTDVTNVRSVSRMSTFVFSQTARLGKCLVTYTTLIRFGTAVSQSVFFHVSTITKNSEANITLKLFSTTTCFRTAEAAKHLVTCVTAVTTFSGV